MKNNDGPERLIARIKSLTGKSNGFHVAGKLQSPDKRLLREFLPFKAFIIDTLDSACLKRTGEFYSNLFYTGFTGIVCFGSSYLTLKADPKNGEVFLEVFMSDTHLNNINLAETIYRSSVTFFGSVATEEVYQSL